MKMVGYMLDHMLDHVLDHMLNQMIIGVVTMALQIDFVLGYLFLENVN